MASSRSASEAGPSSSARLGLMVQHVTPPTTNNIIQFSFPSRLRIPFPCPGFPPVSVLRPPPSCSTSRHVWPSRNTPPPPATLTTRLEIPVPWVLIPFPRGHDACLLEVCNLSGARHGARPELDTARAHAGTSSPVSPSPAAVAEHPPALSPSPSPACPPPRCANPTYPQPRNMPTPSGRGVDMIPNKTPPGW